MGSPVGVDENADECHSSSSQPSQFEKRRLILTERCRVRHPLSLICAEANRIVGPPSVQQVFFLSPGSAHTTSILCIFIYSALCLRQGDGRGGRIASRRL